MNVRRRLCWLALLAAAAFCVAFGATNEKSGVKPQAGFALLLTIDDAIGPATSSFFLRTLEQAHERKASLVILQMDTPGGLDSAMREMIRSMLASAVPVVIYVSPSGARAASAGTYLLYASHVAAMAPATNLGAATPVQIGAPSSPSPQDTKKDQDEEKDDGAKPAHEPDTAMDRKAINDAVAYIRGLAELRHRNAEWAESAVRSATSLTATAALEQKVIDIVAVDVPDLMRQINGRVVLTSAGERQIDSADLLIEKSAADWRTRLLAVLTNPNVAYLLMLVGVYGLLLEGYNPGAVLPGVVGAISLLLALYAFQVLSVNYAGLGLMVLGITLIVAESFVPSFGSLGLGGVAAFVIGSIILMDTGVPGFQIARPLIGGVALTGALVAMLMASYFVRARRRPVVTGAPEMLNQPAVAITDFDRSGQVRIRGEIWNAVSRAPVRSGQRLRVIRVDGLTLEVEPDEAAGA